MSKIPPPPITEVQDIAFYGTPSVLPGCTMHELLVYFMEQPWSDVKQSRGQVIISDLREGAGQGRVVAVYTPKVAVAPVSESPPFEAGQVIQFPTHRREKTPT